MIPTRCQVRDSGEGRVKPPQSLNIGVLNVHGCNTNVEKKDEFSKMSLKWKLDVCAQSETELKRKGEVMFGEVVGKVSDVGEEGRGKGWHCYSVCSGMEGGENRTRVGCFYRHMDRVVRTVRKKFMNSGLV